VTVPAAAEAAVSTAEVRRQVRLGLEAADARIVVVDDDPTGTQTVRDIPLVTDWGRDALEWALDRADPLCAVLTNSRSLPEEEAVRVNRELGERLAAVARAAGVALRVISRGDSTLRGHFPAETEALAAGLAGDGPGAEAIVFCPSYPEAGRVTVDDVHMVRVDGQMTPAAETEFAADPTFGYSFSNLRDWLVERGASGAVASIGLEDLRTGGGPRVAERLLELRGRARYVVANAASAEDLAVLALGIGLAEEGGMRLLYRTGPSFLGARAGLATPGPLADAEVAMPGGRGLVVVGSHTALSTAQLRAAEGVLGLATVELDVARVLGESAIGRARLIEETAAELRARLADGDAGIATTRKLSAADGMSGLEVARRVSDALVEVVAMVAAETRLDWVVAKGGITSNEIARRALGARRATVLGQLFPGQVSVWELDRGAGEGLRYVVFPGNVGEPDGLYRAVRRLKGMR
jgi:uncharacterized protein YgbK (DUF1537 family)